MNLTEKEKEEISNLQFRLCVQEKERLRKICMCLGTWLVLLHVSLIIFNIIKWLE